MIHVDPQAQITFAFWLGVAVVTATLVMLAVILGMRQVLSRRERRQRVAVDYWEARLASADGHAGGGHLAKEDVSGFVIAWIGQLGREGADVERLRRVAEALGLEKHLLRQLGNASFEERIAALTALGHLGSVRHFDRIADFVDDPSPIVSLCAARALMQLDASSAVTLFIPQITRRDDWASGRVAAILREAGGAEISKELSDATLRANADVAPRLVRFLASVSPEHAAPVIRSILASDADDHLVSTCLQVISDPADLDVVRSLLRHERWHVRLHAASAIGRIGVPGDQVRLMRLLSDEQWWVRYRAAQALTDLPFLGREAIARIAAEQTDPFAIDILRQVTAEKTFGLRA